MTTASYFSRGEMWLFITTLLYFLMNGAQIFETAVIVPKWSASPPESLQMLQGKYGIDLKTFWIVMHSIHEITFILAIVFCWNIDSIRPWILILFAIHFAVRVWTLAYFAPNIIEFQKIDSTSPAAMDLLNRTTLWRTLNYFRVGIFIAVSMGLIPLCIRIMNLNSGKG
ncbi:MAG: transposase [Chryseolinea sp.]